ncbi:MAG: hypothetical protein GY756_09545 [bacterium]|nr:hypothetical protein [bacterium]
MIEISGYIYNYKLDSPLSISFHTWYYRNNLIVELKYDNFIGLGEAAPFKPITGDTQEEAINDIKSISALDLNPLKDDLSSLHDKLDELNIKSATLRAAIDFAYHDLKGKILNIPCYNLYSDKFRNIPNSVTVFIKDSIDETVLETKRILNLYPNLKVLKIKLKGNEDIERCKAIKKIANKNIAFTLDANQGFHNPDDAVKTLNRIINILDNVTLIEEPCPKNDLDKMKFVKDNIIGSLIFADESAVNLRSVQNIIKHNAADGVNIKLQKTGGIWPAKEIAKLCNDANLKVMVGEMLDCTIATTAGIHFSGSTDNVILTDLDMDLDLISHVDGAPDFKNGCRTQNNKPGFGLKLNFDSINDLIRKKILEFRKI